MPCYGGAEGLGVGEAFYDLSPTTSDIRVTLQTEIKMVPSTLGTNLLDLIHDQKRQNKITKVSVISVLTLDGSDHFVFEAD